MTETLDARPTTNLRVLVTGGRTYRDAVRVFEVLSKYDIAELCHGDAEGADTLAKNIAEAKLGLPRDRIQAFPADWYGPCRDTCRPGHRRPRKGTTYCPAAGIYRNQEMLDMFMPDLVIAFPGGNGTDDLVARALRVDIPVIHVSPR